MMHLIDKFVYSGFITNKKDYNANYDAGLPVINWSNIDHSQEILELENGEIKKIHHSIKTLIDKKKYTNSFAKMFIMAGDLRPIGTSLDNGKQIINDTPCLLNETNVLEQLPLWVAAKYEPSKEKLELNIIMKSGDGLSLYKNDKIFLQKSFIWSCLTNKNKCISNNDGFSNEMAFLQDSICDNILNSMKLDNDDKNLIEHWKNVLVEIKTKPEYNNNFKYGLDQIIKEINIKFHNGSYNKKNEPLMDIKYPELNLKIKLLKIKLNNYYYKFLEPKIFKYQLIK